MRTKELVCIGCPLGCNLKVEISEEGAMEVTGNTCPRGADYARKELTDPRRIVTSSVKVQGGHLPCVSVKTETDIPKDKIFECVRALKDVVLSAPVEIGRVVAEDVADTGVRVIATKRIYEAGVKLNVLKVDGGASANNMPMQFQADINDGRT